MKIELEKRYCAIKACSNSFKVLIPDKTVTCSYFCEQEYKYGLIKDKKRKQFKKEPIRHHLLEWEDID